MTVAALVAALLTGSPDAGTSAPRCKADAPADALAAIERAYAAKDIEAVVACKDFKREARMMMHEVAVKNGGKDAAKLENDPELLAKAAEDLELAFRAQMKSEGFPDMRGVKCAVIAEEKRADDLRLLTERCTFPDGGKSDDKVLVSRSAGGWRLLH